MRKHRAAEIDINNKVNAYGIIGGTRIVSPYERLAAVTMPHPATAVSSTAATVFCNHTQNII